MSTSALSFKSILDCVSDIVLVTDANLLEDPGPHIVYVNDAFERITSYPRADVNGLNLRFLQGPETSREVTRTIGKALGKGRAVRECVVNYTKDERPY